MKISISGYGEHGKDELAHMFAKVTTLRYTKSTSQFAAELVHKHAKSLGMIYKTVKDCYDDRRNHRDMWVTFIDEYNATDKAALYRDCLKEQDILTGIRRPDELLAAKTLGLDLCIWVDRVGHPQTDATMSYGPELCDIIIENRDLRSLLHTVQRLGRIFHISKCENYIHKFDPRAMRCEYCGRTKQDIVNKKESHAP